ncbi:MAG: DUF1553 domain-containing protein [Chitinophagaceae bacterium]
MKFLFNKKFLLVTGLALAAIISYSIMMPGRKVDFSADVKPILNKKCITCHGGVKAKAGFSVLFREDALAKTESGKPAIIPGDPDGSEMIRRISSNDPEERMPYKHEALSKQEISILKRWIKQGAQWGDHWAYLPVTKVELPETDNKWIRNDVDKFIFAKLQDEKLKPSAQADKPTLLRRVSLDLIGMYPSAKLAHKYLKSNKVNGYELLVDSLLASPHFGERWASLWLDLSRYADTKGYEADGGRDIWKYRDWLIKAFNDDKPYNEFLTEQIAGDLLPDPTDAQYIATAFSRNTMTNDEGGTDNEEFRTAAVMDRVSTTWESLMSTTFACVQCHSHPYDPFRHDEYYKFLAFFNNTRDEDVPGEYPLLREFNDSMKQEVAKVSAWVKKNGSDELAEKFRKFLRTWQPSINSTTADSMTNAVIAGKNYALGMRDHSVARFRNVNLENVGQMVWNFYSNTNGVLKLRTDFPDGPVFATIPIKADSKWRRESAEFTLQSGVHDIFLTYESPSYNKEKQEFAIVFDWFSFLPLYPGKGIPGYDASKKTFWSLVTASVPTTPVMVENPKWMWRKTQVFERGNRLTPGKEVEPAVPNSLSFAMPANAPKNRLGLAMWLTDKRNPLVSRTMVNRLWEQLYGAGIAETLEDMGTQGSPPTHQQLLDHLAWKLMNDHQWSIKKLLKELVMSATYQQESKLTDELKQKDAENKLYARGPRVRLSAEQLRDQHLCISGELSSKMYGPGVMPWQPEGIWLSPYNGATWKNSKGDDQYRRAVYTYWKRTSPYPSMISFDGVQRVLCTARRIRTNTPLQALVTLNDSAYLDMARLFAYRMKKEAGPNIDAQVLKGYELMMYKEMPVQKLKLFVDLYQEALNEFKMDPDKTCAMIGKNSEHTNASTAALVVVANAMMNLDEVIMKN